MSCARPASPSTRPRSRGCARSAARGCGPRTSIVPVSATADRILGFDAVAGGTVERVTLNGEIGVAGTRLVSDNLLLRSNRMNARARHRLRSFGRPLSRRLPGAGQQLSGRRRRPVRRQHQSRHDQRPRRASACRGRVAARTRRIDNATLRDLLGGSGSVTANVAMEPSGLIRVQNIRVASPGLSVTQGGGTYSRNGALDLRLAGVSRSYGPVSVHVTGTRERAAHRAARAESGLRRRLAETSAPPSARRARAGRCWRPANPITGPSRPTS